MAATEKRAFPLTELVVMLRAKCPLLSGRIGGMSVFNPSAAPNLNLPKPYCIVTKTSAYGEPYNRQQQSQTRHAMISLVVAVDNTGQKQAGTGTLATSTADSADAIIAQIEQAMLEWAPLHVVLADTPLYVDEGFMNSSNTTLWMEVLWDFPFITFNPAFGGPGTVDPNPGDPVDPPLLIDDISIEYGVTPNPFFLDKWIYGPWPEAPTLAEIEANKEGLMRYVSPEGPNHGKEFEVVHDASPDYDNQERGMIIKTEPEKP